MNPSEYTSRNWAARLEADSVHHALLRENKIKRERSVEALLLFTLGVLFGSLLWLAFEVAKSIL